LGRSKQRPYLSIDVLGNDRWRSEDRRYKVNGSCNGNCNGAGGTPALQSQPQHQLQLSRRDVGATKTGAAAYLGRVVK